MTPTTAMRIIDTTCTVFLVTCASLAATLFYQGWLLFGSLAVLLTALAAVAGALAAWVRQGLPDDAESVPTQPDPTAG